PEPNQEVDSCESKKTRGRKAVLKEPEPNQEVDSCERKKTRGRKAVLKEPEPNQDVDSCKRKKTSGSKGLLIAPDSVQDEVCVGTLDETEESYKIESLNKSDAEFFYKTCSFVNIANKFISNHSLCDDIYERQLKSRTFLEEDHMMLSGKTEPNQEVDSCESKKTRGGKAVLTEPDVRKLKFPGTNLFEGYPYLK
ncbi:hypothetical protein CEXT_409452, partial [Caerostris extrusa]